MFSACAYFCVCGLEDKHIYEPPALCLSTLMPRQKIKGYWPDMVNEAEMNTETNMFIHRLRLGRLQTTCNGIYFSVFSVVGYHIHILPGRSHLQVLVRLSQ